MIPSTVLDWWITAISWTALALWLPALRLALPYLCGEHPDRMPIEARMSLWTAVALTVSLLAFSSLAYPDLIPIDWSRYSLLMLRSGLAVLGLVAWAELRAER